MDHNEYFSIFQWFGNYVKLRTAPELFGDLEAATQARYWMTFFVFSVLPAPDSPVHKIDWSSRSEKNKSLYMKSLVYF